MDILIRLHCIGDIACINYYLGCETSTAAHTTSTLSNNLDFIGAVLVTNLFQ